MKILIASYFAINDNSPRAFRYFELAKELIRRGHEITIIETRTKRIIESDEKLDTIDINVIPYRKKSNSFFMKIIIKIAKYFIYTDKIKSIFYLLKVTKKYKNYDAVISISLPFFINIGIALSKFSDKTIKIFDCGDPFYYNTTKLAPYWKLIAKYTYSKADFVCIPIEEALPTYYKLVDKDKLRVIPQGIDFTQYTISKYKKNSIPTFIYTGTFYSDIRNPIPFLDFLLNEKKDFIFEIYTPDFQEMYPIICDYEKKMNEKMHVHNLISRADCIKRLSEADFLINLENLTSIQLPSKLIDYSLSGRPILSFSSQTFNKEIFYEFYNGDYTHKLNIDISKYDIKKVTDQFEELFIKK